MFHPTLFGWLCLVTIWFYFSVFCGIALNHLWKISEVVYDAFKIICALSICFNKECRICFQFGLILIWIICVFLTQLSFLSFSGFFISWIKINSLQAICDSLYYAGKYPIQWLIYKHTLWVMTEKWQTELPYNSLLISVYLYAICYAKSRTTFMYIFVVMLLP